MPGMSKWQLVNDDRGLWPARISHIAQWKRGPGMEKAENHWSRRWTKHYCDLGDLGSGLSSTTGFLYDCAQSHLSCPLHQFLICEHRDTSLHYRVVEDKIHYSLLGTRW